MLRLAGLVLLVAVTAHAASPRCQQPATPPQRVVSLTPAITETLFAIEAGPQVAGVSDYCVDPPEAMKLPRLGTTMAPNYQGIARATPGLILAEEGMHVRAPELRALAPTCLLPWTTLDDVLGGMRELGRLTGHAAAADDLADLLGARLSAKPPATAPRVLLVLASEDATVDDVWFIQRNSIQGSALGAAGGRNAVDEDVTGFPRMNRQRLLKIAPDIVILLLPKPDPGAAQKLLAAWKQLPTLPAVRANRIAVIDAPEAFVSGPRILTLMDRLSAELRRFAATP
ncbi:MAG TPA: helical backbone metal receptor [Candidatus Binatia bacterium]|jgi:iron complex transport system substrate-binding protein|nr:helical backbone metal receptor [Candidatus Binatia bacterium]